MTDHDTGIYTLEHMKKKMQERLERPDAAVLEEVPSRHELLPGQQEPAGNRTAAHGGPPSDAAQPEVIRKAIELLCGRIGGCLGETCGCVKGTLDMKPSSETRRKAAWDYLRTAHPEDAAQPDCCSICAGERVTLTGEDCICKNGTIHGELMGLRQLLFESAHPEDAPEGPFVVSPSLKPITGADWCVESTDDTPGVFYGPKGSCEYIRDVLNRLKGDETDG